MPEEVYKKYPAMLYMAVISSRIHDRSVPKQLLHCVAKMLKSKNVAGMHTCIHGEHTHNLAFHVFLGFEDLKTEEEKESFTKDADIEYEEVDSNGDINEMTILVKSI